VFVDIEGVFCLGINNISTEHLDIVEIPRIRVGASQEIGADNEAFIFAKYLRNERKEWIPRNSNFLLAKKP
jgi:hypothetical protein